MRIYPKGYNNNKVLIYEAQVTVTCRLVFVTLSTHIPLSLGTCQAAETHERVVHAVERLSLQSRSSRYRRYDWQVGAKRLQSHAIGEKGLEYADNFWEWSYL